MCFHFQDKNVTVPAGGHKAKDITQATFGKGVSKCEEFQLAGLLGSHSGSEVCLEHVFRSMRDI
jgi:hypothetical protein